MNGAFVLPDDIEIVPLSRLPIAIRAQVGGHTSDYAVTRPRTRVTSKIIDADAAEFLREFEKPTTLIEAILRFSRARRKQATQVLEEVYPFLESCLAASLLIEPGTDAEAVRASFDTGAVVADCQVRECIQVLSDTELYRVSAEDCEAALKITRPRAGLFTTQSLEREERILKHLDGGVAPRILSAGNTEDGRAYLLLEWIRGELCGEAAAAMRAVSCEPLPEPLVSLCVKILDAYATLHDCGVVHSDVHPGNLLVTENGELRIIDLGLSRLDTHESELPPPRGGVGFYFEPEYARAVLSGEKPPISTRAGDQYSAAALVYFLLTGQYYLEFSYGREEMMHQIAEQAPFPLSVRGLLAAAPLDEVLRRGLSKAPAERFPDMGTMAQAFRSAARRCRPAQVPESSSTGASVATACAERQFVHDWLESFLDSLSDPVMELPFAGLRYPTASLTFGTAGIAYGLFRIAGLREDTALYALAERWLDRAIREIDTETGFYEPDIQITQETVGRISPYHTAAGVACIRALVAHSCDDRRARAQAAEQFLRLSNHECKHLDLTLGRSGTLLALSMMIEALRWDPTAEYGHLIDAGNRLLADLWRQFDAMPAISDIKIATYLGIAHGWAGYLYATLRWVQAAQATPPVNCQSRLMQLAEKAQWRGSRAFWPSQTTPNSPVLGGWCNGSAGFVFLWNLAHRIWPSPPWLRLAEGAGNDAVYAREEGTSLCCGLSGKAYSQLNLYKHTGARNWLDNALSLAELAVRKQEIRTKAAKSQIPFSLYRGGMGLAILASDLNRPDCSVMPFFEDEQWPAMLVSQ
jgi:serine/threonine-protein kinase